MSSTSDEASFPADGRSLPLLATSLALGSLSGLALVDGTLWDCAGWGLAQLGFMAWAGRRIRGASGPAGSTRLLLALFGAALLHAMAANARWNTREGPLESAPGLLQGRWQNLGRGPRGFLSSGPDSELPSTLFEPRGGSIPDGSLVSLRPTEGLVPWPAGPRSGPMARAGRFTGRISLHPDEVIVHSRSKPTKADGLLSAIERSIQKKSDELEPQGFARGLVRALTLGDRSGVEAACLDLFTRTGARHALALSGLHVGLITALLLLPLSALLRLLPKGLFGGRIARENLIVGVRLSMLLLFVLLIGPAPPVLRAVCALGVALLAPRLPSITPGGYQVGRRVDGLSIWCLALILELSFNPSAIQQLSLRLSYSATLGILLCTRPLMQALGFQGNHFDLRFRNSGPMLWVLIGLERLTKAWACTLCASIAAVACTLPDIAANFGEFSPTGVLFAPLVIPLLALLLLSAWLSILLQVNLWCADLADALVGLLQWVDRLPGTPMPLPSRPAALLWVLAILFVISLRFGEWPSIGRIRRSCSFLAGVLLLPWQPSATGFELHVIDVGHGTCAVLRAPGLPALIFDAGSLRRSGIYQEALAPLLADWEVDRPWVLLSHDDRDHTSGLPKLIERYPPTLWIGALPQHLGERLAHASRHLDLAYGQQQIRIGPPGGPLELVLLRGSDQPGNEGSRSLLVSWRGERILLAGDAEGVGLGELLAKNCLLGPMRLLLFPHHGSQTPHLSALLAQARPAEIWISAATERPGIAAELDRRGFEWFSTGAEGCLALRLP